jgi:hypothetical protein
MTNDSLVMTSDSQPMTSDSEMPPDEFPVTAPYLGGLPLYDGAQSA